MPTKPPTPQLTEEQIADARRLFDLFTAWQAVAKQQGEAATQAAIADQLGFNQSAVSQYINGKIALNFKALAKFAKLIGVSPAQISPSLWAEAQLLIPHDIADIARALDLLRDPEARKLAVRMAVRQIEKVTALTEEDATAQDSTASVRSQGSDGMQPRSSRVRSR